MSSTITIGLVNTLQVLARPDGFRAASPHFAKL
jgi:hypothetical protein